MKAELPDNEIMRLQKLHSLNILDTPREQSFDDIAQLAMQLCDVSIAVVSLIDTDRQWFKSCIGLDETETSRDVAFCAHAILSPDDILLVEDATKDVRFADNILVTGEPYIRFYAGAPLVSDDGYALGTLCVIDTKPRCLAQTQLNALKTLARQVMQLLRLKSMHDLMQQDSARLASIIEGTSIGTWEWNVLTGEVIFNERWAMMLGYTLEELAPVTFDSWRKLMHPDDLVIANEKLKKHFSGESSFYDCEFRMRKKNGDWHWIHSRGKIGVRTSNGKPLIVSGMHADINEIKDAYNRIKDSEDLLRSLLSNFPGAAYRCENNSNWTMHYLSDAVEQLTGYPARDFLLDSKMTFSAITHPEDAKPVNDAVQNALTHKKSFVIEYRLRRADGQWRHVQELGCGVYDTAGALRFIDGFVWDVTERYEAEKSKKVIDNKMSSLYQMAPVGIVLNSLIDGHFVDANPEALRMTGYTEEEFLKLGYWDITPTIYEAEEQRQLAALKTTGRYGPYEKHCIHKNGELIPILVNGVFIESEAGEPQIWSIVQDVTEQKRVERMKNEFVSTVSHELRTPLTSISGSLGLISNGMLGQLPEKAQAMLNIAYKNSQRLTVLINDLLDMEKLLAGKMHFDMKVQPLLPIVEHAVTDNKSYADKYGVRYIIDNMTDQVMVNLDAFRLQQVLNNFLSNAAKYSPGGSNVDVVLDYAQNGVRISVRDYGSGIPDEFKERIFQKFSQADSSDSREKGGTGLGLAISKELVERMGGMVGFETTEGFGSCFYAEFAIIKADSNNPLGLS